MELFSERLRLREYVAADWEAVLAYQQKPNYLRYYPWETRTSADTQAFVKLFLDQQNAKPRTKFQLVIELKETGQLIGNCGLRLISAISTPSKLSADRTSKQTDVHEADIGYELDPAHWGKGYAIEAARVMVELGFSHFKLHRISSHCIADNTGSAHVLDKLGMSQEGRLRDGEFFKGRYWDILLFGMLRHEWQPQ